MTRQVRVSTRAADDADRIFVWIAERSWDGARRWYDRYLATLRLLSEDHENCALAPEATDLGIEVRQVVFSTRKGNRYRALFLIRDESIHVLGIRGPGQRDVTRDDLGLPE